MNRYIDFFFFNYHVKAKVAVSRVQQALAKVAYKKHNFFTKHAISNLKVLLFYCFESSGREGPLLTRTENFSYNAVFSHVVI